MAEGGRRPEKTNCQLIKNVKETTKKSLEIFIKLRDKLKKAARNDDYPCGSYKNTFDGDMPELQELHQVLADIIQLSRGHLEGHKSTIAQLCHPIQEESKENESAGIELRHPIQEESKENESAGIGSLKEEKHDSGISGSNDLGNLQRNAQYFEQNENPMAAAPEDNTPLQEQAQTIKKVIDTESDQQDTPGSPNPEKGEASVLESDE